ncbi:MAG: CmcJ/NvfI family oxidoreductase [Gammaproteobacteria bacterium]|jgi:hypothetical protein
MHGASGTERLDRLRVGLRYGAVTGGRRSRVLRRGRRLDYEGDQFETKTVDVCNGRPLAGQFSLDREGFEFVGQPTTVRDFFDERELKTVYYPEVQALVQRVTGASRVLIFDHTLRAGDEETRERYGIREPVNAVHNDYTEISAPQRLRDLLPGEAEALLQHRFQIVQVWRPINVPAQRSPLGICDAASIEAADLIPTELRYEDRVGEIYHVGYNRAHRWYYFPDMQPDEALVFKVYDSATDGVARYTVHGAFDVPSAPAGAPPRQSIEVRTMTFFAPA